MLTSVLYPNYKVYGPYTRKDKRKIVVLACGRHYLRLAYAKFLIQEHIGRVLNVDEEVDHKDEDKTNDSLDNLQVLPRKVHQSLTDVGDDTYDFECMFCQKHMVLTRKQYTNMLYRRRNGQVAPFCSHKCVGLYGKQFQQEGLRWKNNG